MIVGVNDIGLTSCSTDFGGLVFGIGTTFTLFHTDGTIPSLIDELKMQARGSHKAKPKSSRNKFRVEIPALAIADKLNIGYYLFGLVNIKQLISSG